MEGMKMPLKPYGCNECGNTDETVLCCGYMGNGLCFTCCPCDLKEEPSPLTPIDTEGVFYDVRIDWSVGNVHWGARVTAAEVTPIRKNLRALSFERGGVPWSLRSRLTDE